jgi:hypothetical protein
MLSNTSLYRDFGSIANSPGGLHSIHGAIVVPKL